MERWANKVAVVTGASSGIGSAIVTDLVKAGVQVVGLARRVERVEELKKGLTEEQQKRLHAHKCDVSLLDSVNEAFDWIEQKLGGIDILINNAGAARYGQLVTNDPKLTQEVIQINVMGVVYCTQRAFKSMKERNFNGHVIIINSIFGHTVPNMGRMPEGNIYSPTKFAITAITEIYRQEFSGLGTKIKISSISPGFVDTELLKDEVKKFLGDRMLKSEDISQGVLYVLGTPPHVQIHEFIIKPVGEMV